VVLASIGIALAMAVSLRSRGEGARCGGSFIARGTRCVAADPGQCPVPLEWTARGCDAPDVRVLIRATSLPVGASDWEADGLVIARTVRAAAFRMAAFESTRGQWGSTADPARAATGMTRDEAAAFCAKRGGRLPTEDEWIIAAASAVAPARRYPWGETGAVCRRAAWGLLSGPCAIGATGPDTVGAHPDGDSPLGLHDIAGNVAEWVAPGGSDLQQRGVGIAKGGSWQSTLATDLRIWARLELDPGTRDARVGVRCAYPQDPGLR
jgi:formylglycine-generating enzyme required for sulfatase activity